MMLAADAGGGVAAGGVARVTRQAVKGSDAAVLRQELEDAEMKVEQCKVLIEFIDVFLCLSAYSRHALLERSRVHNHLLSSLTSICVFSGHPVFGGWLAIRVVSVLNSGAEGPGSNRSRDAVR